MRAVWNFSFFFMPLAWALSGAAQGAPVFINKTSQCVPPSLAQIHASITNYTNYPGLPGATYDEVKFGQNIHLQMDSVRATFSRQDIQGTQAVVGVYLRVANLADNSLRPRFALNCTSAVQADRFSHICALDDDTEHFALKNLTSNLSVTSNDPNCPGQSSLNYNITLEGEPSEIGQIQTAVVKNIFGLNVPGAFLGRLFVVDEFFKSFYAHFYEGWISTLK